MAQQPGSLLGEIQPTRFPPDHWWTPRINRKYITVLRRVYDAYKIDPAPLYRLEGSLGQNSQVPGNLLGHIIAAQGFAAQEVLDRLAAEDEALIMEESDPIHEAEALRQGSRSSQPETSEQQPDWRTNSAYAADPRTRFRASATRNLSAQLHVASEPNLPETLHELTDHSRRGHTPARVQLQGTNAESAADPGRENERFESNLAARQAVFQARSQRPPDAQPAAAQQGDAGASVSAFEAAQPGFRRSPSDALHPANPTVTAGQQHTLPAASGDESPHPALID